MKRTHRKRAVNPESVATAAATTSMASGRVKRAATSAPAHSPTYDADHARTGVKAAPVMTGKSTGTPASRPIAATMMVPASAGRARRASVASRLAAVTIPPIHARNVPNIHQTGRYHHELPPPIASQVQGYALKGRNRAISMALNTMVLTSPTAAAPAMPSVLRAAVHWAGRNATARPAASTISAVTPPRRPATIGTSRDAARNATTATAVATPSLAPPTVTVRKSERSETAGAAVADMDRLSSSMRVGAGRPAAEI